MDYATKETLRITTFQFRDPHSDLLFKSETSRQNTYREHTFYQ